MIQKLRLEMGYSIAEMAECLGIKKSTYQGYDNGKRSAPPHIYQDMLQYKDIAIKFMEDLPAKLEVEIAKKHPHGFLSERDNDWG